MKIKVVEEVEAESKQKDGKVTSSVLEAFDLLRGDKDDQKLTGGAKIISQLCSNQASISYHLLV